MEQAAFLNEFGCEIAQGFLYSKPLPKCQIGLLPKYLTPHEEVDAPVDAQGDLR
jgi:EAL domain-containing protein (putative c-di-GMP-specific phosphodiesterase class I)